MLLFSDASRLTGRADNGCVGASPPDGQAIFVGLAHRRGGVHRTDLGQFPNRISPTGGLALSVDGVSPNGGRPAWIGRDRTDLPERVAPRCLIHRLTQTVIAKIGRDAAEVRDGYWACFDTADLTNEARSRGAGRNFHRTPGWAAFANPLRTTYPAADEERGERSARA